VRLGESVEEGAWPTTRKRESECIRKRRSNNYSSSPMVAIVPEVVVETVAVVVY